MNLQHIPQIKYTDGGNFFLLAGLAPLKGRNGDAVHYEN
jgi:2-dehydro-3-deoxyphosphooctonate aldolase (KDO 8-P synthase)